MFSPLHFCNKPYSKQSYSKQYKYKNESLKVYYETNSKWHILLILQPNQKENLLSAVFYVQKVNLLIDKTAQKYKIYFSSKKYEFLGRWMMLLVRSQTKVFL